MPGHCLLRALPDQLPLIGLSSPQWLQNIEENKTMDNVVISVVSLLLNHPRLKEANVQSEYKEGREGEGKNLI